MPSSGPLLRSESQIGIALFIRCKRRELRAALHSWHKHGAKEAQVLACCWALEQLRSQRAVEQWQRSATWQAKAAMGVKHSQP